MDKSPHYSKIIPRHPSLAAAHLLSFRLRPRAVDAKTLGLPAGRLSITIARPSSFPTADTRLATLKEGERLQESHMTSQSFREFWEGTEWRLGTHRCYH